MRGGGGGAGGAGVGGARSFFVVWLTINGRLCPDPSQAQSGRRGRAGPVSAV